MQWQNGEKCIGQRLLKNNHFKLKISPTYRKWANGCAGKLFRNDSRIIQEKYYKRRFFVARITIEDCLKRVNNRFLLVTMTAKRVRQIREGSEYLIYSPKNEDIVVSLREIAAGKITIREEKEEEIKEEIEEKL